MYVVKTKALINCGAAKQLLFSHMLKLGFLMMWLICE